MIWTMLALLCVVATKFLTSVRLRGLRAKFDSIQPEIDDLRLKVAQCEEEVEALRLKVEDREQLLTNLGDVVRVLEDSLKRPVADVDTLDRVQLVESTAMEESAGA